MPEDNTQPTSNMNASSPEDSSAEAREESPIETPAESDELLTLKRELEAQTARADENLSRWQRAQADFINYKRRVEQDKTEFTRYANASLIARILPLLDDFDRAETTLPPNLYRLTWLDGVFQIRAKLEAFLRMEGVMPIEAEDKRFDPIVHEAVVVDEGVDVGQGQIVEVFQVGYKLHERILRPSLVRVGKPTPSTNQEESKGAV